ncbi:DUF58 domain-containing protein [Gracilimonas mengyeensis]|uniref:Uncharacterized conserved protein, DUF58 family, contains vWF domain n=1 Tax=Gracilimonas mengyeensis TaxID=1302730 RepID=A0A521BNR9_9BACT|nr:DUF58 domain-containing protein [Gracilimonas mengyeensis]SMO48739.1 Uncharacterized conserved protein, DUF58 family, contains vWF domain [Gracilimonas mengyeensis]
MNPITIFKQLHLSNRFFQVLAGIVLVFVIGYFVPVVGPIGEIIFYGFIVFFGVDALILYSRKNPLSGQRVTPQRLSNGDENPIRLQINSSLNFTVKVEIIDEVPHQFQLRDFSISTSLPPNQEQEFRYELRPTQRGEYDFGDINVFLQTALGFVRRSVTIPASETVPVYPSFIQMRKFEMYVISNRLTDAGIKKIRRLGHTMEFDQIKEYVRGDDVRSINWKATARANELMVNQYQDERSQNIINIIDTGRVMKMPFDGLHLLDYAINTSLVISNIALLKDDKAGLITFSNENAGVVKPQKRRTHIRRIQERLYNLQTNFLESDFERMLIALRKHVNQRSLVLLYTNFETFSAMERQLPYLQQIANRHLLVTIFFENTEMTRLIEKKPETLGEIYTQTIAEKFSFEKRQIVRALNQRGIQTILTPPKELSVNAINKYLELKSRGLI